jgi:hypothetical protein
MKHAAGLETEESWFSSRQGQVAFFQNAQIGVGAHAANLFNWYKGLFPPGRGGGVLKKLGLEVDCLLPTLRMRGAVLTHPPPPARFYVYSNGFTVPICNSFAGLHRLRVLTSFSPYLPVYCLFRCYIPLLHHSYHFIRTSLQVFLFFFFLPATRSVFA